MVTRNRISMIVFLVGFQLLSAGCLFGGGGASAGLFGGGEAGAVVAAFSGGGNGNGGGESESNRFSALSENGNNDDGSPEKTPEVAVLHNPEPGSIALFGSGLASLGLFRRRRSKKRPA